MKKKYVLSIALLCAAIICAAVGVWQYLKEKNAGAGYEAIRGEVGSGIPVERTEKDPVEIPIDFAALQAINP